MLLRAQFEEQQELNDKLENELHKQKTELD